MLFLLLTRKKSTFFHFIFSRQPQVANNQWKTILSLNRLFLGAFGDALGNADGTGGAHEAAQVATDALAAHEVRLAVVAEGDGLVAAVHAGHIAPAATNALLAVKDGEDDGVTVQVTGL